MNSLLASLQSAVEPMLLFLADDPMLRILQIFMLIAGLILVFLVFYTTRDILLRTHSLFLMFCSIVLVAVLPVLGFLIYLLIRPSRTLKECEVDMMVRALLYRQMHPEAQKQSVQKIMVEAEEEAEEAHEELKEHKAHPKKKKKRSTKKTKKKEEKKTK